MKNPLLRYWVIFLLMVLLLFTFDVVRSLLAGEPPEWHILLYFIVLVFLLNSALMLSKRFRQYLKDRAERR